MQNDPIFSKIVELADASVARLDPTKVKWQWGEALYTYSLYLLDKQLGENRYLDFNRAYMDAHIEKAIGLINQIPLPPLLPPMPFT